MTKDDVTQSTSDDPKAQTKKFSFLHIGRLKALIITLVLASLITGLFFTQTGDFLEIFVARRVEFVMRNILDRAPPLDDRVKIFAIDDRTVTNLKSPEPSYPAWGAVLQMFSAMKPRAIFIDKIFGLFDGDEKVAKDFINSCTSGVPIYVGSFFADSKILGREQVEIEDFCWNIKKLYRPATLNDEFTLKWLPIQTGFVYGPAVPLQKAFRGIGNINYLGDGYVQPFIRVSKDYILQHMTLWIADEIYIDDDGPVVNGNRIHLDHHHRLLTNLVHPQKTYPRIFTMRDIIKNATNNLPPNRQYVKEGDIAVILPAMFTGNSDMVGTPAGRIPGGFVIVSLINSVLRGNWLKPLDVSIPLIWVSAFVGMFIGMFTGITGFWVCLFGVPLLFAISGIYLFVFQNLVTPWFFGLVSMMLTGLVIFAERFRLAEGKLIFLKKTLQRSVTPEKLDQIIQDPKTLKRETSESIVTLMDISILGLSQAAEQQTPDEAFKALGSLFEEFRLMISSHEGSIDQKLSTNFLSYFTSADKAFLCAMELQKTRLLKCLQHHEKGQPVYPIRIGLNTSPVHIGGLGKGQSLDFALLGPGVDYVKRLGTSCEPFRIMLSPTTSDVLSGEKSLRKGFQSVFLRLTEETEAVEVFEVDPFVDTPKDLEMALKAYRDFSGLQRLEPRWQVPPGKKIVIRSDFGQGDLSDFSLSGLSLLLKHHCAKDTTITLAFHEPIAIQKALQAEQLPMITGEVRWARKVGENFLHGILIKNLNEQQKKVFSLILREHILK